MWLWFLGIVCIVLGYRYIVSWRTAASHLVIHNHTETEDIAPSTLPGMVESAKVSTELEYGIVSKCTEYTQFFADIGNVSPLEVYSSSYFILPYPKVSSEVQEELIYTVQELNPSLTDAYIQEHWGPQMYVMIDSLGHWIGCMAMDRKNFYPCISHLYIHPSYRKQGYAKRFLQHGEDVAKEFRFQEVKLWCKESLILYYERYGWSQEGTAKDEEGNTVWIMKKEIGNGKLL